ncbi:MAG: extracellular solute-binding protein [Planctomycetes bacterium]|nr:extracellular solute-binding protein [Planctomycetota bacterium]
MLPFRRLIPVLALAALACGCADEPDLVVYCALDQVDSERILKDFEAATGLKVRAEFDAEAHKTVGLVRRIREEQARPRCDVFWNNEFAHTVSLADDGLLASYDAPNAASIPETFRDPERRWTGFAARARVFIVNTEKADPAAVHGMWDLLDPKWKGQVCMARPLTGTTLTHAAALYVALGDDKANEYFQRVKAASDAGELQLMPGNGQVMRQVKDGALAWGWTDTDDYNRALQGGAPVAMVFPDRGEGELGTLFIPNTVAILKDAPHPEAARKLVDYLLSLEVERKLASFDGAQIPLHAELKDEPHQLPIADMRPMVVDYAAVGAQIDARFEALKELFLD